MGGGVFWGIMAGFLLGVFARSFFPLGIYFVFFALCLACVFLYFAFSYREKSIPLVCAAVALVACGAGIMRMESASLRGDPGLTRHLGESVVLRGVVSAEPDQRDAHTLLSIDAQEIVEGSGKTAVRAGVLAQVLPHTNVNYGDEIEIEGNLKVPETFDTAEGRKFLYPEYLAASGISYQLSSARAKRTGNNYGNPIKVAAIATKQLYLRGGEAVLPEPYAGLAAGINVGDKRSIGPELAEDFKRASLIHMVVLSGYNITIVINAVSWLFTWSPRVVPFGASFFAVIFFVLMAGGAASAVRAGCMALLAMYARHTHRTYDALRALAIVAVAMVLWNPLILAFDPSFQLSALATLGLMLYTPIFAVRLSKIPERFGLREIMASTLATQCMVLPFLLYQNGQLAIYALPANILALAPVPYAMFFSFIAAIGGAAFGSFASPLAFPAYVLLAYIVAVARFFSGLPFATLSIGAFHPLWLAVVYFAMTFAAWYLQPVVMHKSRTK